MCVCVCVCVCARAPRCKVMYNAFSEIHINSCMTGLLPINDNFDDDDDDIDVDYYDSVLTART